MSFRKCVVRVLGISRLALFALVFFLGVSSCGVVAVDEFEATSEEGAENAERSSAEAEHYVNELRSANDALEADLALARERAQLAERRRAECEKKTWDLGVR